jgi:prepilin-type N-terminal cleavage/methylation domain-containing protein
MNREKIKLIKAKCDSSGRAFTLTEVLVALTVVSVSLLTLSKLHLTSIRASDTAGKRAQALLLANEKISEVIVCGLSSNENSGRTERDGAIFFWERKLSNTEINELDNTVAQDLQKVVVTVEWFDKNKRRSVQLSSLINGKDMK